MCSTNGQHWVLSDSVPPYAQVELVGSPERCGQAVAVEGVGEVAVGVERAEGAKCGRCWNYSTQARAGDIGR